MKKYKAYSGCVMLDLYNPVWNEYIKDKKRYNSLCTEFEDNPHLTLLYGIENSLTKEAHNSIVDYLKLNENFRTIITESYPSIFVNTKIVSKFSVIGGNIDLSFLNSKLKSNFSYESKYDEYNPHITICYSDLIKISSPIRFTEYRVIGVHSSVTHSEGFELIDYTPL